MTINIVQASGVNVVQGAAGYAIIYAASGPMGPAGPAGSGGSGGTTPMTPVNPRKKYTGTSPFNVAADVPSTATIVQLVVENGDARWSTDSVNTATSTEGAPIYAGQPAVTFSGTAVTTLTAALQTSLGTIWAYFFK